MGTYGLVHVPLIPHSVLLALALTCASCGAVADDVAPVVDASPPGFWSPAAVDGPIEPLIGEVLDVPQGAVRVGYWKFVSTDRKLVAAPCDAPTLATVRLRVAPFRLMRFEVTNRVYAECVHAGRCQPPDADLSTDPFGSPKWDAPERSDRPAAASQTTARAFCRAYGGDLPTWHQWVRAAEGDGGSFGIAALTDAWLRCELGEALPLCPQLRAASWMLAPADQTPTMPAFRPLSDVAGSPWDVGPYGHAGLFGGAGEWIRVDYSRPAPKLDCSSEGTLSDDYAQASYENRPTEQVALMQIARDLTLMGHLKAGDSVGEVAHGLDQELASAGAYFTGFRCAFPPLAAR